MLSRQLRLIALCASLVASGACSNERRLPTEPTPLGPTGPTAPSAPQRLAALALFESAKLHAEVTTSPLTYATRDGQVVWTNGSCASNSGSFHGSLDGGPSPASGTLLPTGNHTYVASFSNCLVHYLAGIELDGVASAAYRATDWSNLAATVSADSVRGKALAFLSELHDVTADGSAVWTRVGSNTTYTPAAGSRLINNATNNVAAFGGGSYSVVDPPPPPPPPPPQGSSRFEYRFDNLKVAIDGTEYTLDGSLDFTTGTNGTRTHAGDIRITNNGTLVSRIYGDVRGALSVEVLVPLVPL